MSIKSSTILFPKSLKRHQKRMKCYNLHIIMATTHSLITYCVLGIVFGVLYS